MSAPVPQALRVDIPDDALDDLQQQQQLPFVPVPAAAAAAASSFPQHSGLDQVDAPPGHDAIAEDDLDDIGDDDDDVDVDEDDDDDDDDEDPDDDQVEEEDDLDDDETDFSKSAYHFNKSPHLHIATSQHPNTNPAQTNEEEALLMHRRRRDVRAARDRLGEQFDHLRRVLPVPPPGVELNAKAQVLEYSLDVIHSLMTRARDFAIELAVVNPDATRRWVRHCSDDGRKPLMHSVGAVMKLFAARRDWRYAEWWTLDETRNLHQEVQGDRDERHQGVNLDDPEPVMDDPANVHGCVVRDSVSVMRLAWTLIQRSASASNTGSDEERMEDEELARFAKASSGFEFKPRIGMPGRVWTSRRAEWLIDLADREIFSRSPLAKEFGMKTCLAVPIQFGGHVHSVMAFYAREVRGYNPDCYDLVCLLSQCLEDIYSPSNAGPWQVSDENLFPSATGR